MFNMFKYLYTLLNFIIKINNYQKINIIHVLSELIKMGQLF